MPQADFYASGNNTFGAIKSDPAVYDNVTKVWGTHSLKFGFYWDKNLNSQSMGPTPPTDSSSLRTTAAPARATRTPDELTGRVQSTRKATLVLDHQRIPPDFLLCAGFLKASRRLTINFGVRFDRVGQYFDPSGPGYWVWDAATYINTKYGRQGDHSQPVYHRTGESTPRIRPFRFPGGLRPGRIRYPGLARRTTCSATAKPCCAAASPYSSIRLAPTLPRARTLPRRRVHLWQLLVRRLGECR